jgi:uncharacterized protein YhjY with autotransporter beta-barrel domain
MNAEHPTDRSRAPRVRAFLRLTLFSVALVASGLASATGCRLEFGQTSPITLLPGASTTLTLSAADAGSGACTAASFNVATVNDTTAGTALTPLTGTAIFGGGPVTLNVTAPGSPGGSITWQAVCASGCEATNPPNPTFTVTIGADVFSLNYADPTSGTAPIAGGETRPFSVRLLKNGQPTLSPGEDQVCFEFVSGGNPNGATLGSGPPCGVDGRLAFANGSGVAAIQLIGTPAMCSQTRIRATAIGFPTPQAVDFTFTGQTPPQITAVTGAGQSATANTVFTPDLSAVLICPGGAPLPNKFVRWERVSGNNVSFDGGASNIESVTDASGASTARVTALSTPGPAVVRVCADPACTNNVEVPLTVLAVGTPALVLPPGLALEGRPDTGLPLNVLVLNDGEPAAGVQVNWSVISGASALTGATSISGATGLAPNSAATPPTTGSSLIRATRSDDPSVFVEFQVDSAIYSLQPLGQGGASLTTAQGVSATLEAQLLRQVSAVQPVAGRPISFSVSSGPGTATLQPIGGGSSDGAGIARTQFTASVPGSYVVTASHAPGSNFQPVLTSFLIDVTGGAAGLRITDAPERLFSDETTAAGVQVQALLPGQNGEVGAPNVSISALVRGGAATFADGTSLATLTTDADGFARTPPLAILRTQARVEIEFSSTGLSTLLYSDSVTPSTYRVAAIAPTEPLRSEQPLPLSVRVTRQGSGSEEVLAGANIGWSASGGRLIPTGSTSDAAGIATSQFTASTAGNYTVNARFFSPFQADAVEARFELALLGAGLSIVSGDGQTANAGTPLPFAVVVEASQGSVAQTGVPVRLSVLPAGSASVNPPEATTGSDGRASFTVTLASAAQGTLQLRAERTDVGAQATGVVRVGTPPQLRSLQPSSGDGQSGMPGQVLAMPLRVLALNDGVAAPDVPVNFSVQPAGAAIIEPASGHTGTDGHLAVQVRLAAMASGAVRISAVRSDDPAARVEFTAFAGSGVGERRLEIESGNNQAGPVGARASELVVLYTLNGLPVQQAPVQWSVLEGPAVLDAGSSVSDAQGRARIGVRFGASAGASRIRAQLDDLDVVFTLSTFNGQLQIVSGNAQTGTPGQALAQPLRVRLLPQAVAGVAVQWQVRSGGGSVDVASTSTGTDGEAEVRWTLGPQAGLQTVAAQLAGGAEVVFEASAQARGGVLEIVSGNAQQIGLGTLSEPLTVRVRDASGAVQAGRTVRWTASNAVLSAETSQTDAAGVARVQARLRQPGAASIRAALEGSAAEATFALNGGLADIGGLNPRQRGVAGALDQLCPALAALSSRSQQQQDLFERCSDFIDAASDDRPGLQRALDELPNDVGLNLARAGDEALRGQVANLDQRLRALRSGDGANSRLQVGLGLSTPNGMLPLSALPGLALAVDGEAVDQEIGAGFERWGAFLTGSFGRGRSRGPSLNPEFDYSLGSLTAGVDYRFSDRLVLGAALGISRDDTDLANDRGGLESRGTSLSAYASLWLPKDWYLDANLTRGSNQFDMRRNIRFTLGDGRIEQIASASTDADLLGGSLALGRDWNHRALGLGAYLRAQFSQVDYDGFSESLLSGRSGEGLGLYVESPRWNSREAVLGGRASYVLSRDWGVLMPNLLLEYSREFSDDPSRLDLRFLADPTLTVFSQSGAPIDQSHMNLGLGVSALFPGGRSAFVQYERRLLDERINHWLLSIGGRIEF